MQNQSRMSPLTALFLGIFGVGGVGIAAGTATVLYAMKIIDGKAASLIGLAERTVEELPQLLESLPPSIADVLNDRRDPLYAENIGLDVEFSADREGDRVRPVLKVTNRGDQVVSMLAVRVVALEGKNRPLRDWTGVVATPIALDDRWEEGWPGPLLPGKTRYFMLQGTRSIPANSIGSLEGVAEVSEIRVWQPTNG